MLLMLSTGLKDSPPERMSCHNNLRQQGVGPTAGSQTPLSLAQSNEYAAGYFCATGGKSYFFLTPLKLRG